MPKATVDTNAVHKDLATCEGGFVDLKRMPYTKWLRRQEMAIKMSMRGGNSPKDATMDLAPANEAIALLEFQECVVDHNLEDAAGNSLDFRTPQGLAQLDPMIGSEISALIMEMHEFDEGNSPSV